MIYIILDAYGNKFDVTNKLEKYLLGTVYFRSVIKHNLTNTPPYTTLMKVSIPRDFGFEKVCGGILCILLISCHIAISRLSLVDIMIKN